MAGSWSRVTARGAGDVAGGRSVNMIGLSAEFTADDADASIPDLDLTDYPIAFITDIGVKFDGTTPPDACAITIKDVDGLTIHPNDTISLTASGRYVINDRPSCIGGVTLSVASNTTNEAKAIVTVYCVLNQR